MCCSSVVPAGIYELMKVVIGKTAYKFCCVRYFQARCYAVLYLRAGTLSPHFRKVSSAVRENHSLFKRVTTDMVTLNISYFRSAKFKYTATATVEMLHKIIVAVCQYYLYLVLATPFGSDMNREADVMMLPYYVLEI